ncbi:MAG: type I-U CRISPR-associated protein Csx17 [Bryobacteraceae bacterium]|nr:type I-U CRISPR-associated protein Csx17 [Bryobacteraceae bacterium]
MPVLQFPGCAVEPLGDYLKALGVFRLVAEQITDQARCWWRYGIFHLWVPEGAAYRAGQTSRPVPSEELACREWLETFLLEACEFSPLLSPWQKNTGLLPYGARHRGSEALFAILKAGSCGPYAYRVAVRSFAQEFGLDLNGPEEQWVEKLREIDDPDLFRGLNSENEQGRNVGRKSAAQGRLIERTRNACDDPRVTTWLDTVGHPKVSTNRFGREREWFSLLGEGAAEGSGGMIVSLEVALADVLSRKRPSARQWLRASLWGASADGYLSKDYSIGLFYPSRKETPNSGQDFESKPFGAAWDVILLFEGVLLFAGSMARRMNARKSVPAYPFYCSSSLGGNPAGGPTEIDGSKKSISSGEVWCPIWTQPATLRDLRVLFSEGRMQIGGRDARLATQFIRALARFGCDRGIDAFQRYGLLRRSGSIDKKTYTLAVPLGIYSVSANSDLALLDELIDYEQDVLDASGQRAILNSDSQPRRIIQARCRFEDALFSASRSGLESHSEQASQTGADFRSRLIEVAVAAALLDRECGVTDGRIPDREGEMPEKEKSPNAPCAPSLSYDWLRLKHVAPAVPPRLADLFDDGTPEWRLARALGTICPWGKKPETSKRTEAAAVGPIRENLVRQVRSEGGAFWSWERESRRALWSWESNALSNCASVMHRRLVDAQNGSGKGLPLFSPYGVNAQDLLALWRGQVDERRLSELIYAFALVRPWRKVNSPQPEDIGGGEIADESAEEDVPDMSDAGEQDWLSRFEAAAQLPRAYALLKLCFLGGRLPARPGAKRTGQEPCAPGNLHILNLLLAGRGEEACTAAARRLHAVGYPPVFATSQNFSAGFAFHPRDWRRLAGLLLVPITFAVDLARLIIKPTQEDDQDEHAAIQ